MDSIKAPAKSDFCEIVYIEDQTSSTIDHHRQFLRYFHRYFYGKLINRCRLNSSWMLNIEHSRPYMRMHINFEHFLFMSLSAERAYRLYSVSFFFVGIILFQCCWPDINWSNWNTLTGVCVCFFSSSFHSCLSPIAALLHSYPALCIWSMRKFITCKVHIIFEKMRLLLCGVSVSCELWVRMDTMGGWLECIMLNVTCIGLIHDNSILISIQALLHIIIGIFSLIFFPIRMICI